MFKILVRHVRWKWIWEFYGSFETEEEARFQIKNVGWYYGPDFKLSVTRWD
jgi:hypothetical protein